MSTNDGKIDIGQLDDAFQYARDIAESVQIQLSKASGRSIIFSREKELQILYRSLKKFFTIEQVWERINDTEREILFGELPAADVVTLRRAGLLNKKKETGKKTKKSTSGKGIDG